MSVPDAAAPRAPFSLPAALIAQMQAHACAAYPGECCGLVFARADDAVASRVLPMENIQDRLHALDPVTYPRTSRDGFQMNALRASREIEAAVAGGERLLAIFHSHVDCPADFSQEDRDMAAPPPARAPLHPGVWHIVIACWPDGIREARAFRWNGEDFAPCALSGFAREANLVPAS